MDFYWYGASSLLVDLVQSLLVARFQHQHELKFLFDIHLLNLLWKDEAEFCQADLFGPGINVLTILLRSYCWQHVHTVLLNRNVPEIQIQYVITIDLDHVEKFRRETDRQSETIMISILDYLL